MSSKTRHTQIVLIKYAHSKASPVMTTEVIIYWLEKSSLNYFPLVSCVNLSTHLFSLFYWRLKVSVTLVCLKRKQILWNCCVHRTKVTKMLIIDSSFKDVVSKFTVQTWYVKWLFSHWGWTKFSTKDFQKWNRRYGKQNGAFNHKKHG